RASRRSCFPHVLWERGLELGAVERHPLLACVRCRVCDERERAPAATHTHLVTSPQPLPLGDGPQPVGRGRHVAAPAHTDPGHYASARTVSATARLVSSRLWLRAIRSTRLVVLRMGASQSRYSTTALYTPQPFDPVTWRLLGECRYCRTMASRRLFRFVIAAWVASVPSRDGQCLRRTAFRAVVPGTRSICTA